MTGTFSMRAMFAAAAVGGLLVTSALAIQPERWVHTSEADFTAGESEDTVVTNLGDIKLAQGMETLSEIPEEASVVYEIVRVDGEVYIAAGPEGKLLRKVDDSVEVLAELEGEQIFALARRDGELIVAISGETSRIAAWRGGELVTLAELEDVRYIWDLIAEAESFVIGTGTEGRVLRVTPGEGEDARAEVETLLDTEQSNVLAIGRDDAGRYYAGTDTEGLVYRIRMTGAGEPKAFVLYDAPEAEIGALWVEPDGTVYAGTASAEQARPGRLLEPAEDPAGRPEDSVGRAVVEEGEEGAEEVPEQEDLPQVPPGSEPIGDEELDPGEGEPPVPGEDEGVEDEAVEPGEDEGGVEDEAEADAEADAAAEGEAEPTPEQRDELREVIRERLQSARETGEMQVGAVGQAGPPRQASGDGGRRVRSPGRSQQNQAGNAIYRIGSDGFVSEVFRESVMVLRIVRAGDGGLLVTTGNEGQVYRVDPAADETTILTDLQPEQVPAAAVMEDGDILLGTANPAEVIRLSDRFAARGRYTSEVLDADQISLWGTMNLTADIPEDTSVLLETRSGNVEDPEQAPWSEWSEPQAFVSDGDASPLQPRQGEVDAPPARFLQYRLTLLGDPGATPAVNEVKLAYVTPNMGPEISSISASYPEPRGDAGPGTVMNVDWEASDPNEDTLVYRLAYRPAGSERYIQIAEDIENPRYEWQTRRVPDGRYVLRVVASDRRDNPGGMAKTSSRVSDPVLVDNTAPRLAEIEKSVENGEARIAGVATDALSAVDSMAYAVDGEAEYHPILPRDLIFDSTREAWRVRISDLAEGPHVVTLRISDTRGNTSYHTVLIDVK